MRWFLGIDPGQTGGLGVLDAQGGFVGAWRWDSKAPINIYNRLILCRDMVNIVYIEMINAHPGEGLGHVVNNMSLVDNLGTWKGFLFAAGIPFTLIHPATWQAAAGLRSWQAKQKLNPALPSPLSLARSLWPAAPLPCLADDGKAVALILADLARRDHLAGFDRGAAQAQAQAQAKIKKAQLRKARKLASAQNRPAHDIGW
jgi:hypothetical protein